MIATHDASIASTTFLRNMHKCTVTSHKVGPSTPLFICFFVSSIQTSPLTDALADLKARGNPYVGAFLTKDQSATALDGSPLYDGLHATGTFAQVQYHTHTHP